MPQPSHLTKQAEALSRGIVAPTSYLHGRIVPPVILPNNMLCFVRWRANQLNHRPTPSRTQHHRYLLITALRGEGRICINDTTHALGEGHTRIVLPFQYHSYLAVRPAAICWVFLTFEMENDPGLEHLCTAPSQLLSEMDLLMLTEILRQWKAGKSSLLQLHLATLLGRLGARKRETPRHKDVDSLQDDPLLTRVNRHVLAQPGRRIVLKQLAAAVGQSESHLRRRFRIATGLSLGRHLRELRIQQACSLLHRTSLSVGEIAHRSGFDSIYSFSRAFTHSLSISPRGYRQQFRPA